MRTKLKLSRNNMFPNAFFYISSLLLFAFCFGLLTSCQLSRLERKLDPESKEFLSKVRYIISSEERKIFIELPPAERKKYREEFWKRRDPDPDTEFNEFKEQYFSRIEEANKLFRGGKPGWLQDRGRIFILLGPPDQIIASPMGKSIRDKPHEVWYYGMFPIIFIDQSQNGDYELTPLSARHIAKINEAQIREQRKFKTEKALFDFDLEIKKGSENEVFFYIEVPYRNIWFVEKEDKLETTLELSIEVLNSENQEVWQHKKEYKLSVTEQEIEKGGRYPVEIPVILEKGKYIINFSLLNKTGEEKRNKKIEIEI